MLLNTLGGSTCHLRSVRCLTPTVAHWFNTQPRRSYIYVIGTGCLSICLQYLSVHNWLVNFFSERRHCTRYGGCTSAMLDISASIIQWSAVDPVSYVINTGDLATVVQGNRIHKYADDTYIIIPASNVQHREAELEHVAQWAQANNLKLNRTKSVEVIFSSRRKPQECHPPKLLDICHVSQRSPYWSHVDQSFLHQRTCDGYYQQMCSVPLRFKSLAMPRNGWRRMRWWSFLGQSCWPRYCRAYASSAWWSFANSSDKQRLEEFMRHCECVRLNFYRQHDSTVDQLVADLDDD